MALSQKTKEAFLGPLNINNPVLVQILGICSALAVTVQLKPALWQLNCSKAASATA